MGNAVARFAPEWRVFRMDNHVGLERLHQVLTGEVLTRPVKVACIGARRITLAETFFAQDIGFALASKDAVYVATGNAPAKAVRDMLTKEMAR